MNSIETNPEIIEARKKLAEKFGNMKLGGKGSLLVYSHLIILGSQRRKEVPKHKSSAVQDKKIQSLAKKARKKNNLIFTP